MAWRIKIRTLIETEGYKTRKYLVMDSPAITLRREMEAFGAEVARVSLLEGMTVAAEAVITLEVDQPRLENLTP